MLNKYKITWTENNDGDHSYESKIIEAKTEDEACDIWERDVEPYVETNGMQDCVEIYDTPLFKRLLYVDMPDGITYALPVEVIARHRAAHYADKHYDGSVIESLRKDTVPLFLDCDGEIIDWAQNNMNWSDVKDKAHMLKKKAPDGDFEDAWVNGDHTIS